MGEILVSDENVTTRPQFSISEIQSWLHQQLAIDNAKISQLPGERDQNFLISIEGGTMMVMKIANENLEQKTLNLQNELLEFLRKSYDSNPGTLSFRIPKILSFASPPKNKTQSPDTGNASETSFTQRIEKDDRQFLIRFVEYLPGQPLAKTRPQDCELITQIGEGLGDLTFRLQEFSNDHASREFSWDLALAASVVQEFLEFVEPKTIRDDIEYFFKMYQDNVAQVLPSLRKSVIHSDANDYNLIIDKRHPTQTDTLPISDPQISLIDFGDVVYSHTINELAICLAYIMLDNEDPIEQAECVVAGFHRRFPITDNEFKVLFPLACMRLCVSVCMSANQSRFNDDPYLAISREPAQALLSQLSQQNPRVVEMRLRQACGLSASPNANRLEELLKENSDEFHPLMGVELDRKNCLPIDLSVENCQFELKNRSVAEVEAEMLGTIRAAGCEFGFGGYNEPRLCYSSVQFRVGGTKPQQRTIHIGLDIFANPGTPLFCPWDATVHSFADNDLPLDYGPTIILRHDLETGSSGEIEFFTLYGHLSRGSIEDLCIGQPIKRGERFAEFGSYEVNGGWPAHVHFQVMSEMLGLRGDFPGACAPDERELWTTICPDPNLLLQNTDFDADNVEWNTKKDTVREQRAARISPSLSMSYQSPLHIVRGENCYLYDVEGRQYLDMVNNVCHVGHANEHVVKCLANQAAKLNTNTRYLHKNITSYAKRLCDTLPSALSVCFFVNSGSEANDLALRLARNFTSKEKVVCLDSAYHGHTRSLIDVSPYKFDSIGGNGCPSSTLVTKMPDTYRGKYREAELGDRLECGKRYANDFRQIISDRNDIAGFICESILGCGGQVMLPPGFLPQVFQDVKSIGGVNICDEVQVGFGRVGSEFWGFELYDVEPDIVTMGKPIGNGHPLAAVVTTREIADAFDNGMEYFNTFGGNPVSCAVGLAVLDEIQNRGLQQHAFEMGELLRVRFQKLGEEYKVVGDVRGTGLFWGIEFVDSHDEQKPAPRLAKFVVEQLKTKKQILLSTDGPDHNVIKLKPPMVITRNDLEYFLSSFEKAIHDAASFSSI